VSALVLAAAASRPFLAVGWLWYLGTLVPVIGLVQVGSQAIAERYTYIPLIGAFVMAAWGIPSVLPAGPRLAAVLAAMALAVLALCAALTYRQAGFWKNNVTLFRRDVDVEPGGVVALTNLASALDREGR